MGSLQWEFGPAGTATVARLNEQQLLGFRWDAGPVLRHVSIFSDAGCEPKIAANGPVAPRGPAAELPRARPTRHPEKASKLCRERLENTPQVGHNRFQLNSCRALSY